MKKIFATFVLSACASGAFAQQTAERDQLKVEFEAKMARIGAERKMELSQALVKCSFYTNDKEKKIKFQVGAFKVYEEYSAYLIDWSLDPRNDEIYPYMSRMKKAGLDLKTLWFMTSFDGAKEEMNKKVKESWVGDYINFKGTYEKWKEYETTFLGTVYRENNCDSVLMAVR